MIVVDTSALIAILTREPEHSHFLHLLDQVERRLVSAVTYYEAGIVMQARAGAGGLDDLNDLLQAISAEIVPFDQAQAASALTAYARYGKGIDPKARLNLGDCASYALAKGLNAPLLFRGTDFAATDVVVAISS
jgi:ribonuclease VapC